jgi:hypothetical protein
MWNFFYKWARDNHIKVDDNNTDFFLKKFLKERVRSSVEVLEEAAPVPEGLWRCNCGATSIIEEFCGPGGFIDRKYLFNDPAPPIPPIGTDSIQMRCGGCSYILGSMEQIRVLDELGV